MKKLVKYQNRKIYDSDIGEYVNLTDVENYIINGAKVVVKSHKTGKNVTNEVFGMIIAKAMIANKMVVARKILAVAEELR